MRLDGQVGRHALEWRSAHVQRATDQNDTTAQCQQVPIGHERKSYALNGSMDKKGYGYRQIFLGNPRFVSGIVGKPT